MCGEGVLNLCESYPVQRCPSLALIFATLIKMTEESKKINFIASLPPIQSAIQINGLGDGALIKLELPATEMMSVLKLQLLAGKTFRVIIEEVID